MTLDKSQIFSIYFLSLKMERIIWSILQIMYMKIRYKSKEYTSRKIGVRNTTHKRDGLGYPILPYPAESKFHRDLLNSEPRESNSDGCLWLSDGRDGAISENSPVSIYSAAYVSSLTCFSSSSAISKSTPFFNLINLSQMDPIFFITTTSTTAVQGTMAISHLDDCNHLLTAPLSTLQPESSSDTTNIIGIHSNYIYFNGFPTLSG